MPELSAFNYLLLDCGETPDASNTDVFRRGTFKGLRGKMPVRGQCPPNSEIGARLEW